MSFKNQMPLKRWLKGAIQQIIEMEALLQIALKICPVHTVVFWKSCNIYYQKKINELQSKMAHKGYIKVTFQLKIPTRNVPEF